MNKRQAASGLIGTEWYSPFVDPIGKLSRYDKTNFWVFVIANLFFGQFGLWFAGFKFLHTGLNFGSFWDETISSGALFTFAIALTTSVLATIAFEFFDDQRNKEGVHFWQHKVWWSLIAAILIVLQASLIGDLLASSTGESDRVEPIPTTASATVERIPMADTKAISPPETVEHRKSSAGLQVIFWLISMFVAVQLYCLTRLPSLPNTYAKQRSEAVADLTTQSDSKSKTFDGEML